MKIRGGWDGALAWHTRAAMGLIIKSLEVIGTRGRRRVKALFDSGASYSLINEAVARRIADPVELPEPKTFHAAVGTFKAHRGRDRAFGRGEGLAK